MMNAIHRVQYLPCPGVSSGSAATLRRQGVPAPLRRAVARIVGGRGTLASLVAVLQGEAGGSGTIEVVPPTARDWLGDEVGWGRVVWRAGDRLEGRAVEVLRYRPLGVGGLDLVGLGKDAVSAKAIGQPSINGVSL